MPRYICFATRNTDEILFLSHCWEREAQVRWAASTEELYVSVSPLLPNASPHISYFRKLLRPIVFWKFWIKFPSVMLKPIKLSPCYWLFISSETNNNIGKWIVMYCISFMGRSVCCFIYNVYMFISYIWTCSDCKVPVWGKFTFRGELVCCFSVHWTSLLKRIMDHLICPRRG